MDYEHLTAEERLSMLRPRLADLERQHFAADVEATVSGGSDATAATAAAERRRDQIADSINLLRAQMKELEEESKPKRS